MATKKYNHERFVANIDGREFEFMCWTTSNRNGFCHYCYTDWYGNTRRCYINRTWERFTYESVLESAIDKFPKNMREELREQIIEGKYKAVKERCDAFLGAFEKEYSKLSDTNKEILKNSPEITTDAQAHAVLGVMKFMNLIDAVGV